MIIEHRGEDLNLQVEALRQQMQETLVAAFSTVRQQLDWLTGALLEDTDVFSDTESVLTPLPSAYASSDEDAEDEADEDNALDEYVPP